VTVPFAGSPRSASDASPPRAIFHLRRSFASEPPLRSTTAERCDALARHDGNGADGQSEASTCGTVVVVELVVVGVDGNDVVGAALDVVVLEVLELVEAGTVVEVVVTEDDVVGTLVLEVELVELDVDVEELVLVDDEVVVDGATVLLDVDVVAPGAVVVDVLVVGATDVLVEAGVVLLVVEVVVASDVDVVGASVLLLDDVELVVLLVVGATEVLVVGGGTVLLVVVDGTTVVLLDVEVGLDVDVLLDMVVVELVEVDVVVVVVVVVARHAPVFTSRRHWLSVPTSAAASSEMVSVQVPFGSSPTNAASGSSGTSGVAGPLGPQLRSVTRPLFEVYGT
jgi:hypothetical protein